MARANTNPRAVSFDDLYPGDDDKGRALARAILIGAKHRSPDEFKTLQD